VTLAPVAVIGSVYHTPGNNDGPVWLSVTVSVAWPVGARVVGFRLSVKLGDELDVASVTVALKRPIGCRVIV
jgi:hypothetical protein